MDIIYEPISITSIDCYPTQKGLSYALGPIRERERAMKVKPFHPRKEAPYIVAQSALIGHKIASAPAINFGSRLLGGHRANCARVYLSGATSFPWIGAGIMVAGIKARSHR